ncbi:MAG: MarR family transcriptional regulator [Ruminococcaceae bacterium]|nr:MarR family transcriptional regulator [Oscillospiraceae bacterium]
MIEDRNYVLIHKIITANRMHKKAIETVVDDIGIHRSRHQILMNLAKNDKFKSQKEIAEHLGITQAAMTGALSKLERDGLISRTVGADNRYNEISITEKGREIIERSRAHFIEVDKKTFSGFSDEELEVFSKCIDKMQNNLKAILEEE